MKDNWIATKDQKPPFGVDILISNDGGQTVEEECVYLEKRTCMLAGVGGGNGYFGEGFATNGSTGCESGLILDTPTHWKISKP